MIDLEKLKLIPHDEPIPYDIGEQIGVRDEFEKGLSPEFGDRKKRQASLVARLKRRRKYGPPVKGGTGKHSDTTPSKRSRRF